MKDKQLLKKSAVLSMLLLVGISAVSYACGMGAKAPSDEGKPAPAEEVGK